MLVFRGRLLVLVALLSLVVMPSVVRAQVLYGGVVGTVKDAQGAAIPAATVVITNKENDSTRETVTGAEGEYTIANVLAWTLRRQGRVARLPRIREDERAGHRRSDQPRRGQTRNRCVDRDRDGRIRPRSCCRPTSPTCTPS